jgi:tRNA pseudouridine13 synthase
MVADLQVEPVLPDDGTAIAATFVLPKGGYATTLLARAFRLVDAASPPSRGASERAGEAEPEEEGEAYDAS